MALEDQASQENAHCFIKSLLLHFAHHQLYLKNLYIVFFEYFKFIHFHLFILFLCFHRQDYCLLLDFQAGGSIHAKLSLLWEEVVVQEFYYLLLFFDWPHFHFMDFFLASCQKNICKLKFFHRYRYLFASYLLSAREYL